MMRVALTGATGFLGRNLLFEIVKRNLQALDRLQVVVLGRFPPATEGTGRLRPGVRLQMAG
jgi:nucleoside-diphosphate-sugar epimerase